MISIDQIPASFPKNIRLDNYYTAGTVVRPNDSTASPLSVFSQDSLGGYSSGIIVNQVFSGSLIPNNLNNNIHSLDISHEIECFIRNNVVIAKTDFIKTKPEEKVQKMRVRFRTIGDATCTGATISDADTLEMIINEVSASRTTERGGRADDKRSEAAMEDRKKEGYF